MNPLGFRYSDGVVPNLLALTYTLLGWTAGVLLLALAPLPWKLAAIPLVAHTLITSAYFIHEFAHLAIFVDPGANARWGTFMSWLNGACYADFAELRNKHMRHHVDRADVLTFDYKPLLRRSPFLRRMVVTLEWAYVPAVEMIMHGYVMALPFLDPARRQRRPRLLLIATLRGAAFLVLGWYSPIGLLAYALAYLLMLHVLRFADAYQHTYDAFAILQGGEIPADKLRDRDYEQRNTYSNVVLASHPLSNLLLLNFSYHNAHHARPIEPWYRLPALQAQLFPSDHVQVLPMATLLGAYHRHRVSRLLADDYGEVPDGANGRLDPSGFLGAVGVSFLTAV
jgi:fatty acid desaturase